MPTTPASDKAIHNPGEDPVEKARLRREIRARRRTLPAADARLAARRAAHRLWSLPALSAARNLALYLPNDGEIDCTPVAVQAWRRGRSVFLPVVTGNSLRFAPFSAESGLKPNRFDIPEPVAPVRDWRSAHQLDVIIAPLVAFDLQGHRLGMGGGYYDRTLAFLRLRSCARRPHFVGLGFEFQQIALLPADAFDVRLDAVVTEATTHRFA